jgi:hypothetical protein
MTGTPEEKAEAAAVRRRWVTLGEVLAVAAVAISGLGLWNSYSERSSAESARAVEKQEQAADRQREAAKAQTLLLKASGGGQRLKLAPADPGHAIQSQTMMFPATLGVRRIDTVIDPRIEAGWIEDAVLEAREKKRESGAGDARVPIAITTRFVNGGETFEDSAIYDIGYRVESGLLDQDMVLLGLSLVERTDVKKAQARLDALWASRSR